MSNKSKTAIINGLIFLLGVLVTKSVDIITDYIKPKEKSEPTIIGDTVVTKISNLSELYGYLEQKKSYEAEANHKTKSESKSSPLIHTRRTTELIPVFPISTPTLANSEVEFDLRSTIKNSSSFSFSGDSPNLLKRCPEILPNQELIKINPVLVDRRLFKSIAGYKVVLELVKPENDTLRPYERIEKDFKPKDVDKLIFKNTMTKGQNKLMYGYFLKKDSLAMSPWFHKITCEYNI